MSPAASSFFLASLLCCAKSFGEGYLHVVDMFVHLAQQAGKRHVRVGLLALNGLVLACLSLGVLRYAAEAVELC